MNIVYLDAFIDSPALYWGWNLRFENAGQVPFASPLYLNGMEPVSQPLVTELLLKERQKPEAPIRLKDVCSHFIISAVDRMGQAVI